MTIIDLVRLNPHFSKGVNGSPKIAIPLFEQAVSNIDFFGAAFKTHSGRWHRKLLPYVATLPSVQRYFYQK